MSVTPMPPLTIKDFFLAALRAGRLAHGYVLTGRQYGQMYQLALEMAQILNCENATDYQACGQCRNCQWIARNAHPAVMTVSRLTFLVDDDKGHDFLAPEQAEKLLKSKTPTMIKTAQIARLIMQLGVSSPYHRVVIFTDVEELTDATPSNATPPQEWAQLESNEGKSFHVRPLDRHLFNASSANRFLKTLEEPPPRTMFFYITDSEENLLETIVSRCQVVPYTGGAVETEHRLAPEGQGFFDRLMTELPRERDTYRVLGEFEHFWVTEQGLSYIQALALFQTYLHDRFADALSDEATFRLYRGLQESLSDAQAKLNAKAHTEQTLVELFFSLKSLLS